MTDTERLNKLQELTQGYGRGWIVRLSSYGRGIRIHESSRSEAVLDIRKAIDNFIRRTT